MFLTLFGLRTLLIRTHEPSSRGWGSREVPLNLSAGGDRSLGLPLILPVLNGDYRPPPKYNPS